MGACGGEILGAGNSLRVQCYTAHSRLAINRNSRPARVLSPAFNALPRVQPRPGPRDAGLFRSWAAIYTFDMVRNALAFLLVGVWLLAQSIPPHWHGGMSAADQIAHARRPHVHRHGPAHGHDHGHTHHDHGEHAPDGALPAERSHDADAIYLSDDDATLVKAAPERAAPPAAFVTSDVRISDPPSRTANAVPRYGGVAPVATATTHLLL